MAAGTVTTESRAARSSARRLSTDACTLGEMVLRAGTRGAAPALAEGTGERAAQISYAQLTRSARDLGRALIALGVERGDRVAILANTRPEWTVADMGAFCAGAVVAPIYHTNSPDECAYVLSHSEARVVFCEDAAQVEKIRGILGDCPELRHVIVLDGRAEGAIALEELRAIGANVPEEAVEDRVAAVSPHDLATLIYTSGTTGPPKGCELTHENFLAATHAYQEVLDMYREDVPIVYFMFLPLAHSLARIIEVSVLDVGGTLAFWSRSPERLLEDIRELRPTYFPSVPRVFEKIYTAAHSGVADQPRVKQAVFRWAIATGRRTRRAQRAGHHVRADLAWQHRMADRLVLSKVRELFGGRLELAASGAAPIAKEVLEFFDACGVLILEGWGMTETTAAGAINRTDRPRFGTVGEALPGTELRIADDGELLMRGPSVFRGYFKDPEATEAALTDGWLATGDIAQIEDGFVSIVGRKKELIITSSGKNISPANLENGLKESRWISQAVVYGDNRPYLVALITLDPDEAPKLAERLGIDPDPVAMARDERVRAVIQEVVDELNTHFARIEQIKRFALLDRDLSQAAGELTPTLKIKRAVVNDEFAAEIDALYAEPRS
jgi:long-chain acyl-CoA synthetase